MSELITKANMEMKDYILDLAFPEDVDVEQILVKFEELGDAVLEVASDGRLDWDEVWTLGAEIIGIGKDLFTIYRNGELAETMILLCEKSFDFYIVPFDIPYLPEPFESSIEQIVRSQIRPALMSVFEKLGM